MSFLLDTCVVSEAMKPAPDLRVMAWLAAREESDLHVSVLTLGELTKGIERLPPGAQKSTLETWRRELEVRFAGRLIGLDAETATLWGSLSALLEARGTRLSVIDGLIAATALRRGLTVVTRNVADFSPTGVSILDPWALPPP